MGQMRVSATGRYFALLADGVGPVFEKFAVFEALVHRVRNESRGPDGVIPGGKVE